MKIAFLIPLYSYAQCVLDDLLSLDSDKEHYFIYVKVFLAELEVFLGIVSGEMFFGVLLSFAIEFYFSDLFRRRSRRNLPPDFTYCNFVRHFRLHHNSTMRRFVRVRRKLCFSFKGASIFLNVQKSGFKNVQW